MKWVAEDIQGGVPVTRKMSDTSAKFRVPCIISRIAQPIGTGDKDVNKGDEKGYILVDLQDGYQYDFSKALDGNELKLGMTRTGLAAYLTEHHYVPATKVIRTDGLYRTEDLPENRLGLPMVIITNSQS